MNNKYLQVKLKADDFLISDHASLSEDLNRISDDLIKAKWYFKGDIGDVVS
jgi:hypothetical protein